MQTYTTTRSEGEGILRAEILKQLLADVPDHATIEITTTDMDDPRVREPHWWFMARWPVERDYVAEAQADRDAEAEAKSFRAIRALAGAVPESGSEESEDG